MADRPKIIAGVEARMGSTRLPGKVLADVAGKPALDRLCTRLKRCRQLDGIVIATTTSPGDAAIADWAGGAGLPCFRGSEADVLGRVVQAQQMMDAEVVVEICGDMPLLDPELVDRGVEVYLAGGCDVVSTTARPSYPVGVDVQVFSLADLEWVADNVPDPEVREHVSLYFYQHPERYGITHLTAPEELRRPDLRLVLDHDRDLELIRGIWARLESDHGDAFTTRDILDLVDDDPELARLARLAMDRAAGETS